MFAREERSFGVSEERDLSMTDALFSGAARLMIPDELSSGVAMEFSAAATAAADKK